MTFNELKAKLGDANLLESDWHQHKNGGGWVQNSAHVDDTAFINEKAIVYCLFGRPRVSGDARVSGNAWVYGDAWVYGNARVYGNAQVSGDAWKQSPLFIIGTSFALANCKHGHVQVGCECRAFDEWIKKDGHLTADALALAKRHNFTDEQIAEYEAYFQLFKKIGK